MITTVVGHGPSPLGMRLGSLVDEHHVIRMHDRLWQTPDDYGARTDYTVIPGPWGAREHHPKFKESFTELVKPSIAWISFTLAPKKLISEHLGKPVLHYDIEWFVELLKPERRGVSGIVPTRGTVAVLFAIDNGASTVQLLGFDSVVAGIITGYAPGAVRPRRPLVGRSVNSRHDFEREHEALWRHASEKNVSLNVLAETNITVAA